MNTASTASTRPRFDSGVTSGTSVARMNTLIASAPDNTNIAMNATAKRCVTPSAIVATPKVATAANKNTPTRRRKKKHPAEVRQWPPPESQVHQRDTDPARGPQPADARGAHVQAVGRDR